FQLKINDSFINLSIFQNFHKKFLQQQIILKEFNLILKFLYYLINQILQNSMFFQFNLNFISFAFFIGFLVLIIYVYQYLIITKTQKPHHDKFLNFILIINNYLHFYWYQLKVELFQNLNDHKCFLFFFYYLYFLIKIWNQNLYQIVNQFQTDL
ncbi:hypothetical protein IMG5_007210, partial [Ichthyophthirius multifiliis]